MKHTDDDLRTRLYLHHSQSIELLTTRVCHDNDERYRFSDEGGRLPGISSVGQGEEG
jgi:hypothetical protein